MRRKACFYFSTPALGKSGLVEQTVQGTKNIYKYRFLNWLLLHLNRLIDELLALCSGMFSFTSYMLYICFYGVTLTFTKRYSVLEATEYFLNIVEEH